MVRAHDLFGGFAVFCCGLSFMFLGCPHPHAHSCVAVTDDDLNLCPPAEAMQHWIRSRLTNDDTVPKIDVARSAQAPGGDPNNAFNMGLTLKQRLAATTCRQEERGSRLLDLRAKYVQPHKHTHTHTHVALAAARLTQ